MRPAQRIGAARAGSSARWDGEHEALRHDDDVGVAAKGVPAVRRAWAVVGEEGTQRSFAVLLETLAAGIALAAGVDEAADADQVTRVELRDLVSDANGAADDLVARQAGVDGVAPIVPDLVPIGMADAAEENLNRNVLCPGVPPREPHRSEEAARACGGVANGWNHGDLD